MRAKKENIRNSSKMLTMPVKKLVITLSLPLMISMLVQSMYNLVDSIFVARISEAALSAASLAAPFQQVMMAVSVGTGIGVNSLISRALGEGNSKKADLVATTGLILSVLSALIFVLFGVFLSGPFIGLFAGGDAELLEMGTTYLSVCTIFCMGIFLATTAERLLQATGNAFLSMVAQASGAVVNCILDPIMIFGLLGCPAMGIRGAAIATVIGQWCAAAVALIMNFRLNHDIHFDFRSFKVSGEILKGIYAVAIPSILVQALTNVLTMIVNKILIGISATAVAFFGLYHKVQNFVLMPMNGMAMSVVPICGQAYGAKMGARMKEAAHLILKVSGVVMAVCMVIFLVFPKVILALFAAEEGLMAIGVPGLRILSASLVCMSICNVIGQVYTAVGNGMVNLANTFIYNVLPVPFIYFLAKFITAGSIGINYIWLTILIANMLAFLFSLYMQRRLNRGAIAQLIAAENAAKSAQEDTSSVKSN